MPVTYARWNLKKECVVLWGVFRLEIRRKFFVVYESHVKENVNNQINAKYGRWWENHWLYMTSLINFKIKTNDVEIYAGENSAGESIKSQICHISTTQLSFANFSLTLNVGLYQNREFFTKGIYDNLGLSWKASSLTILTIIFVQI